jgi:hypothetical protein
VFLRKQAMALKTPRLLHPQVMAVLPSSSSSTGLTIANICSRLKESLLVKEFHR